MASASDRGSGEPPVTPKPVPTEAAAPWETLFEELVELPAGDQERRLAELAATDPLLAARLTGLLAADANAPTFLSGPLPGLFADALGADVLSADASDSGLAGGTLIADWRVLRLLGRGGMGEVYLAERADGSFAQRVAIKLVQPAGSTSGILRRFLRERQILANLEHPNIARLLDGGTAPDGRPYFVLEWVDGEPITAYVERSGLGLEGRLELVRTVCAAVDSAHRRLVVHRDLKPGNILVTADGTVKLLDFGIAKLLAAEPDDDETLTHLGRGPLTPAYAAPEQILGEPISTATDVYALGVVLYELLTGELPHPRNARTPAALVGQLTSEVTERPSACLARLLAAAPEPAPTLVDRRRWARRVAGDLDLIVLAALHREPGRRYRSAAALGDDLGRFLAGRPIHARPDEVGYRLRRFVARHRLAVLAATLTLVTLLASLGMALHQASEARLAARRADQAGARAERVKSFLVSIFRQSDPYLAEGGSATARELLARGSERIESELAGEPAVHAELLEEIARIETNLGLLAPALAHARRALAVRDTVTPTDDGRRAQTETVEALVLRAQGSIEEARASLELALPRLRTAYGEDSLPVAAAERQLAGTLHRPGDLERAPELFGQALATYERRLGVDHADTAATELDLGGAWEQLERYPQAEAAYRRAADRLERLGPRHPQLAEALAALAGLLDRLSRSAEARPLLERAIAIDRAALGAHHGSLGEKLFSYGILLLGSQDTQGADAALREALTIFGIARFEGGHCLRYLGLSAMRAERYDEAARLFSEAAATYARTIGPDDVQRHRALANLGWAHLRLGRTREALGELAAAVADLERLTGGESYELRLPLKQLGEAQTAAGQGAVAVATLQRVRGMEEKLFATREHREVGGSDLLLARALLARAAPGDRTEARRVLDEASGIFSRVSRLDLLYGEVLMVSGQLAEEEGDLARARADLGLALPILVAQRGPEHADTRRVRALLASLRG
jgi:serine/threonine-protein kinase